MEIRIGQVSHYYSHLGVAVVELSGEIKIGDPIHFLGHTTDFDQVVTSLEIRHHKVMRACQGQEIAVRVFEVARKGDALYRVVEVEEMGVEALGL